MLFAQKYQYNVRKNKEKGKVGSTIFDIRLADRVIRIHAIHNYTEKYCKDYIPLEQEGAMEDSAIDFEVTITQSDAQKAQEMYHNIIYYGLYSNSKKVK